MTETPGPRPLGATPPRNDREELRRLSQQFEGLFLFQLFQAMRANVPQGGLTEKPAGQDMFTSLLDERLASEASARMQKGLGEALYRQLSRRLAGGGDPSSR